MRRTPSRMRSIWMIRSTAAGDLGADRARRQVHGGHLHHVLDAAQRVARGVGVDRADRAVVAGVHGLQHVVGLGAADLAHDDAVGPHTQRIAQQLPLVDLAAPFQVRGARLQPDHVRLLQLQLRCVLDGDDALVMRDHAAQGVQQRGLAGAGAAGDQDVARGTAPRSPADAQRRGSCCRLPPWRRSRASSW